MNTFYTSQSRFNAKIIKRWDKRKFKYHAGNVQLLKYSFETLRFLACVKGKKISKENRIELTMKLF